MVKIKSKQANIKVKMSNPKFEYEFKSEDDVKDVDEAIAEIILKNNTFYLVDDKKVKVKTKKKGGK